MFGINFIKAEPTQYVFHYQNGRLRRAGPGLAFYYYRPSSSILIVPISSVDVPFIFTEMTSDFQAVTIQGQLLYQVTDPAKVASVLDFSIDGAVDRYRTDDPEKIPQRFVHQAQVYTRAEIARLGLQEAPQAADRVAEAVFFRLQESEYLASLGVKILDFAIVAIKPTPEMIRALEAEARERLLQQADEAIYTRRNAAVEQERLIKENELNTELAVQAKEQQIREGQVMADLAVETREQEVRESQLAGQIQLEEARKALVQAQIENQRTQADAQAYTLDASLQPLQNLDEAMLQLLSVQSVDPRLMVSMALREIAQNAGKIGHLNISPDLMQSLMAYPER
jgi:hypothetical protein